MAQENELLINEYFKGNKNALDTFYNENINTDILVKICNALKCDVADIMEYIPEENVEPEVAVDGTSK